MYNVYIDCLVCGDSKYHEDVILDKNDCFTCDYCIDKKKEKEDMINLIKKNYKTMKKKELLETIEKCTEEMLKELKYKYRNSYIEYTKI